jgi:hypothetical protein
MTDESMQSESMQIDFMTDDFMTVEFTTDEFMQMEDESMSMPPIPIPIQIPIESTPSISPKKVKKQQMKQQMKQQLKKQMKQKEEVKYIMPTKENYNVLLTFNYTIKQLKEITIYHKIKINCSLAKAEIINKIYSYFKHYDNAVVIQRAWRSHLLKQYNKLRGPARFNRSLCVNETDFFTMDDLKDIPYTQFFSFRDEDQMIYGFDMLSIYTLFHKGLDPKTANPYNRNILAKYIKKNVLKLLWFSRLFKEEINVKMVEEVLVAPTINDRAITLFHDIDILGNYSSATWFLSLSHLAVMRFMIELNDIWSYRANLSEVVKREICPSHRDLFRMMYMVDMRIITLPIIQDIALTMMEMLVREGINRDSRCLGANFVLCALTLVNHEAAIALPWLFQSVL